jgi:hypothetical protein
MTFPAPRGADDMTVPGIVRAPETWEQYRQTAEQSITWWGMVPNDDQAGTRNAARLQAAIDYAILNDLPLSAPSGDFHVDVGVVHVGSAAAHVTGFMLCGKRPGHGAGGLSAGGTRFIAAGAAAVADLQVAHANINAGANTMAAFAHGKATGDGPARFKTVLGTLPGGLERDRDYWYINIDSNTFKLATSHANALALTAVDLTSQGTGDLTLYQGSEPIIDIRNASAGRINDIAFEGENVAKYGIRMSVKATDAEPTRQLRMWNFDGCSFGNAAVYNFFVEGDPTNSHYGDASGLDLSGVSWLGSHGAATFSHFRNSTQYSFGITIDCALDIASSASWPTYGVSMKSGTVNVGSGVAGSQAGAAIHLDCGALIDPPAFTWTGCESQSAAKMLVTEIAGSGCNVPIRNSVIVGSLIDDIGTPYVDEQIVWDYPGPAALIMIGCSVLGDVNIVSATGNVFNYGTLLRASNTGTGNDTHLSTFTGHPERAWGDWREQVTTADPVGVLKQRTPLAALPTYADNAAALVGGLIAGDLYKTSIGALLVCLG